jgi:hypothetical protein
MLLTLAITLAAAAYLPGCGKAGHPDGADVSPEPLSLRRTGGTIERITFADAMAWHHSHEEPHAGQSHAEHEEEDHEGGLCAGVAAGYQAIRYATGLLFPDEIPQGSDFEMTATGPMRGLWDMLELYAGRELERPEGGDELSLQSFTFTARRVSTGERVSFHLREGLIPPEFFALKNRGLSCDHPDVKRLKAQAARTILSRAPEACFVRPTDEGFAIREMEPWCGTRFSRRWLSRSPRCRSSWHASRRGDGEADVPAEAVPCGERLRPRASQGQHGPSPTPSGPDVARRVAPFSFDRAARRL